MAANVTQELKIVYGSLTTGSTSEYPIIIPYTVDTTEEATTVSWRVAVHGSSEANFESNATTLEAEMRNKNGDISITIGATVFLNLTHSGNTGYLARPAFSIADDHQTGRSRIYDLSVTVNRPADEASQGGLRESRIEVAKNSSGMQVMTMTGTYTATAGSSATTNHAAASTGAAARATTITTALTGTFEATRSDYTYDDQNKTLEFVEQWTQIGTNQSAGTLDNANIKQQSIVITRKRTAPGDEPGVERFVDLDIVYSASIDREQTTDLTGIWASTIRGHLIDIAKNSTDATGAALVDESVDFHKEDNRISASLTLRLSTTSLVLHKVVTEDAISSGTVLVPVWDADPFARAVYQGPARHVRTVTEDRVTVGAGGAAGGGSGPATPNDGQTLGGSDIVDATAPVDSFFEMSRVLRSTPLTIGLDDDKTEMTISSQTTILEKATTPSGGGVGLDSGPTSTGGSGTVPTFPGA